MDRLIPMTDFVLQQSAKINDPEILARLFVQYAKFLKQPLTLGMFVPCDLYGNVLEEPNIENDHNGSFFKMQTDFHLEKEYQEAKERCLFERLSVNEANYILSYDENNTIEDIVSYKIELTKTTLKQIGYETT